MKQDRRYVVMGFGLAGNHGDGIENGSSFTSSWYLKPEDLQQHIDNGHYPQPAMEGCILIDKRAALDANPSLSFDAPMVGVKLQDDQTNRMVDLIKHDAARVVLSGVAECNATVALLSAKAITDDSFIGLDKVSPMAYAAWWQRHGARLGTVHNGRVVWQEAH